MYALGVCMYTCHVHILSVYATSLDKWVWCRLKVKGATSPSLAAHACAVIGAKLYLFGGLTPAGNASDELYCLDTGTHHVNMHVHVHVQLVCMCILYMLIYFHKRYHV